MEKASVQLGAAAPATPPLPTLMCMYNVIAYSLHAWFNVTHSARANSHSFDFTLSIMEGHVC